MADHSAETKTWTVLNPPLRMKESRKRFLACARALLRVTRGPEQGDKLALAIEKLRHNFIGSLRAYRSTESQTLLAAGLVLTDLVIQGWPLRVRKTTVEVSPPVVVAGDHVAEKARIRRQELIKRDAQLQQSSVQTFVRSMETARLFSDRLVSIFSLMRDGRELSDALRKARTHSNNGWANALERVVDPYLQFVSDKARCSFTGLRLVDIWRYFRHTWTNQYTSVPGRSMMFIVRDRAAPFHPVIGIGALSSPIMQIRERDIWIGWHPSTFLSYVKTSPTNEVAKWLVKTVDRAIKEIYVDDFIEDEIVTSHRLRNPSHQVIENLQQEAARQRLLHHRYVKSRDHKSANMGDNSDYWANRARTHLFRSKRALALAELLNARTVLLQYFGARPSGKKLALLALSRDGEKVICKILRKAKANRVGISVADISVCGAVQPYNAILGGKLVSMLAASPEVALEYRRRYAKAESEIASAMAGRPVIRDSNLVLFGTTSLYGVGSSQYNRVMIPCDRIGGKKEESIRFEQLGYSESFGTSQYANETVDALVALVQQSENGQRVNNIFGEGVSPKLRKVREGLDLLNFPSGLLLRHHRRRIIFAVGLVRNLREYLLGIDREPDYLLRMRNGPIVTSQIAAWWRERWLRNRINSDTVLEEVGRHTVVRPLRHGARVVFKADDAEQTVSMDCCETLGADRESLSPPLAVILGIPSSPFPRARGRSKVCDGGK